MERDTTLYFYLHYKSQESTAKKSTSSNGSHLIMFWKKVTLADAQNTEPTRQCLTKRSRKTLMKLCTKHGGNAKYVKFSPDLGEPFADFKTTPSYLM